MVFEMKKRSNGTFRNVGFAGSLLISVSGFAVAASAQTTSEGAAARSADPIDSAEIIVTARKQAERAADVPIAMQVLGEAEIGRYATQSFSGLADQVAGLSIGNTSGANSVSINLRGIGAGNSSATIDQAVSVNLDGLQVAQGNLLKLGFHDVERVEVLKGPQALFYGKNSPGGVLSIASANPGPEFEASVQTGYEIYSEQKFIEAMVSAPLAEGLGVRIVGYFSDQEGWFRNLAPNASEKSIEDRTDYFVRGTLRYESGGFDNTTKVSYAKSNQRNGLIAAGQVFACPLGRNANHPSPPFIADCKLNRTTVLGDPNAAARALNPLFDHKPFVKQEQLAIINSANLEVGDNLSLASVTTYYDGQDDFFTSYSMGERSLLFSRGITDVKQFTQELRATSSYDGPVNVMAGAFYQKAKIGFRGPVGFDSGVLSTGVANDVPVLLADEGYELDTEAYSIFGQLTFNLTSQIDFNVGGRYSHEEKEPSGFSFPSLVSGGTSGPITFAQPKASFDNFSPEITLRYKPSDDLMLYGTYRHGFISGGYNLIPTGSRTPFDQQKVKGGEVGAKGALMDRQLRFDLAAYSYKYQGLQLSAFDGQSLAYSVTNAAGAKSYGVDFSLQFRPRALPGLSLRTAVAWNHARYGSFENAACYTGQTPAAGCNLNLANGAFRTQDLSGERLVQAADWSGNIGATYETPIVGDYMLSLSADAVYKSAYMPMLEADPRAKQKDSWLLNANVSVRDADDRWEFAIIGKNLTNVLRVNQANSLGATGFGSGVPGARLGDLLGQPSDPRSLMLRITLRSGLLGK